MKVSAIFRVYRRHCIEIHIFNHLIRWYDAVIMILIAFYRLALFFQVFIKPIKAKKGKSIRNCIISNNRWSNGKFTSNMYSRLMQLNFIEILPLLHSNFK